MTQNLPRTRLAAAARASAIHLTICIAVAAAAAATIFLFWFPGPFRSLSGGWFLFWLIVGVDVVCGPLLTAVLFSPTKTRRALAVDFSLVAFIQLAALGYGIHSISLARPVVLAFEVDRFAAVSYAEVDIDNLDRAPAQWRSMSWHGPVLLGTREPKDNEEYLQSIDLSLQGQEPSARPGWWEDYEKSRPRVQRQMKKLADLRPRLRPPQQAQLDKALEKIGSAAGDLYYLPLVSEKEKDTWIVLLDAQGTIVGYAPADGFA